MEALAKGLYEALVTDSLRDRLDSLPDRLHAEVSGLDSADAADRIARFVAAEIERAVLGFNDDERAAAGAALLRSLVEQLQALAPQAGVELPISPAQVLRGIFDTNPDGTVATIPLPQSPLLDTTLLTTSSHVPTLWTQLQSEIASADRIDLVMAFIRRSGVRPLLEGLRRHCDEGKALRVLTTIYTGSTEREALELLQGIGAVVKVSYDTTATRLHAKAWLFARNGGVSTAFIGSSNLTHQAQNSGNEWNLRIAEARNAGVISEFSRVFDSYWVNGDFKDFVAAEFDVRMQAEGHGYDRPRTAVSGLEVTPRPFQERLLELVAVSRERGHHRNLLVAATGTGKTVMAALDYARLAKTLPRARLLFVAHREEILDRSLATFAQVLKDPSFGEKWVGGHKPQQFEHVFASIQTLAVADMALLSPDHFDVVIVDEFHHAAASSYGRVLDHLRPIELLGLTATPERSDGLPILHYFDDRIAAELRLWDAIDQLYLSPFMYYGIHDQTDLTAVPWRRGQGYDADTLSDVYTGSDLWSRLVIQQVQRLANLDTMRCLGFCVGIAHAEHTARAFNEAGIAAVAVSGSTPRAEREAALRDLDAGRIRAVFSVDLFSEGVDVPDVDTILMLRPTESPVLFLQQLGRGLRRTREKPFCTVLDFVGTHRKEFRFDRRYRALLGGTRRELERAVEDRFPYLPSGCSLQLDRKATEIVLQSIKQAIPSQWPSRVRELQSMLGTSKAEVTLASYLKETGLELDDVYSGGRGWSDLLEAAGALTGDHGAHEIALRRACGRLLHVDDHERIGWYRTWLDGVQPDVDRLSVRERRLLHMLIAQVADAALTKDMTLQDAVRVLWAHPQVRAELVELLGVLEAQVDHLHPVLHQHDWPLVVHARYTRAEILAGFGVSPRAKIASWQSGVYRAETQKADLFAITLDKSTGGFSPTTSYRDYAMSRSRFHWESQSATRADGTTGERYQNHQRTGDAIMLFARLRTTDRAFWFLGPGRYVRHEGERPMAIEWDLEYSLPGDLYAKFAAAVA